MSTLSTTTHGSEACGEQEYFVNDTCIAAQKVLQADMKFIGTMTDALKDPNSNEFKAKAAVFENLITNAITGTPVGQSIGKAEVVAMRQGSIEATVRFMVSPSAASDAVDTTTLASTLNDAVANNPALKAQMESTDPIVAQDVPGTASGDSIKLTCDSSSMNVDVSIAVFPLSLSNISLVDCPSDTYTLDGNLIVSNFTDCARNITQHDDVIIMQNMVKIQVTQKDPKKIIQRATVYYYKIQCTFNRRLNISSAVVVNVVDKREDFEVMSKTNFTAEMKVYESSLFTNVASSPHEVTSYEPIHIQIQGVNSNHMFKFITEQCYATPTPDPNSFTRYLFFDEKCGVDDTFKELNKDTWNKFSYSINAFKFLRVKNEVYFHCRLLVCMKESTTEECTQACKLRKKRSIGDNDGGLETIFVNTGAVKYKQKSTCSVTTCPSNSKCVELFPAQCRCVDGYVFDESRRQCVRDNVVLVRGIHIDAHFQLSYYDKTSYEFLLTATNVQNEMMKVVDRQIITGVKMIEATPGSVVVDVLISYVPSVTSKQAFDSFTDSILNSISLREALRIKHTISPWYEGWMDEEDAKQIKTEINTLIIAVVVVVALILLVVMAVVTFIVKRRRRMRRVRFSDKQRDDSREVEDATAGSFQNTAVSIDE
jgi:hypothetical protein